jgi:uncharacterized protein YcfL
MPSSVDNEYAALSAVYGPGLSIQDMRLRKYGGPTVPAKSVADLEYLYWGPSTSLSNADKKLAYLQNATGKTGQSIDDLTSLSIGSAVTTVRNIVDRPAPVALTNWSSQNAAMWLHTYSGGVISVERLAGATGFVTAYVLGTGIIAGSPNLPAGSQWQRSVEVFSTVPVTVTFAPGSGGYPTGQQIPANVWTTIRNNFIGSGSAQFVMAFQLIAASDPGLGILTQLRHAMLVQDTSTWRTNQAINPGYESGTANCFFSTNGVNYPITADTTAPISGTRSATAIRAGTLNSTLAQIMCSSGAAKFPVVEGQSVTGGVSVKSNVTDTQISTRWYWYDAAVVLTQGPGTVKVTNMVAGQVYRVADTTVVPPGTVNAYFVVSVITGSGGNCALGNQVWIDQLTLENAVSDGSWVDPKNGWTGTVDASTSVVATKQIAYADGGSLGWAWEGAANASPSTGPVSYVPDRVNLATNPGYESGTNSIQTGSIPTYVLSADTVSPIGGSRSALFTKSATVSSTIAQVLCNIGAVNVKIPVTEGQPITGGLSIKTDTANAQVTTRWFWYDSGSVLTQGAATTRYTGMVAGQVYRVTETGTPPPGTVTAYFCVTVVMGSGNTVGGEKAWADYLTLENGTTDGSWF